jgi:hypothetical protein
MTRKSHDFALKGLSKEGRVWVRLFGVTRAAPFL